MLLIIGRIVARKRFSFNFHSIYDLFLIIWQVIQSVLGLQIAYSYSIKLVADWCTAITLLPLSTRTAVLTFSRRPNLYRHGDLIIGGTQNLSFGYSEDHARERLLFPSGHRVNSAFVSLAVIICCQPFNQLQHVFTYPFLANACGVKSGFRDQLVSLWSNEWPIHSDAQILAIQIVKRPLNEVLLLRFLAVPVRLNNNAVFSS